MTITRQILNCEILVFYLALHFLLSSCALSKKLNSPVSPATSLSELRQQIDAILEDSSLSQSRTGIKIVSLQSGETWYARDSHLLFHPASNMKLLTTAAGLKVLGTNYKFKTELRTDTTASADSAIGNLYFKGYGNPALNLQDLWWMVFKLKELGVTRITGDLVCDESYFDDFYFGEGWMHEEASSWYWPPISALTVNRNCVVVKVTPGKSVGDSLVVTLEPATEYLKIENTGVTVDSTDTLSTQKFKVERKWRQQENTIVVEGGVPTSSKAKEFIVEVVEPARYAGTLLSQLLASEHISFSGEVRKGTTPDTTEVLVNHSSAPFSNLIQHTNKVSDNLFAELILKTLGAETRGAPGTAEKGISAIHRFFSETGIDTTRLSLADGSGVSRYDLISPDQIMALLEAMHRDFGVQAEFISSLPIAGVDGTLTERMKGTAAENKLRAKTGSLRGVSTLAGYTTTADGEPLAFSMMMGHFVVPTSKIRAVQDRICAAISGFQRK
jgi:PBP4 family serine-type D-alanyl-D-alanine carboxypeptidase